MTGATIDIRSSEKIRNSTAIRTYMNIHSRFVSVSNAAAAIIIITGR